MEKIQSNDKRIRDEHLERLWHFMEEEEDSMDELKNALFKDYSDEIIDELVTEGLVDLNRDRTKIRLNDVGKNKARQVIRAHRIAERMMHDVLGKNVELAACEFEHTIATEIVDSICILLGHPKECPHGKPIPPGECCKASVKTAKSTVSSLTDLKVGQSARVAYVHCKGDQQLHKLDGMQIKPGALIKLHQVYPTYVIECADANIALDSKLAANICLWKESSNAFTPEKTEGMDKKKDAPKDNELGFGARILRKFKK